MCNQCEKKPVYEFTNKRKLCASCFIRYFQKKFLYSIRKFKMIKRGETIGYENKCFVQDVVLKDLLELFLEKDVIKLVKLPAKNVTKLVDSSTLDSLAYEIILTLIKGDVKDFKTIYPVRNKPNIINPLFLFLDKEVLLYAKLRKLRYSKNSNTQKNKLSSFINLLEKKHPEIKRAIVNSYFRLSPE